MAKAETHQRPRLPRVRRESFCRPSLLTFSASGFSASGAASANNTDPYFQSLFPSPTYETPGAPGKHWVTVEVSQDATTS